MNYFE
jgi:hypothetical protein